MKKIFTLFAALTMVLSMFAATETVYFVNASSWTGTINAYAWTDGGANNQGWPGVAAAKEAEQIAGYDVYSYTAETGAYAKVIFNNGSSQTVNLDWTAGKYFVVDGWYTKEEAEDKLATPIPDTWTVAGGPESVFGSNWNTTDANNDMVKQANGTYKWEKTGLELVANSTISFKVVKNHAWDEAYPGSNYDLSIPENGIYTITITFDPSTTSVNAVATKTSDAEVEVTISYVLMGVADDWTTGIALTANPDNANEYVLLGQTIAEGDAVKVVTLTNGEKTAYCGNVDEYSVEHSADKDGNIVLAPGTYDFYYKVAENLVYIGAAEPELSTYTVTLLNEVGAELEGAGEYEEGTVVTIVAPKVSEWYFVGWAYEDGEIFSNDASTTVNVEGDLTITAIYAMMMNLEVNDLEIIMDPVFALVGTAESPMGIGTFALRLVVDASAEPGEDGGRPLTEDSQIWLGEDTQLEILEGVAIVDMENNAAKAMVFVADEFGLYYLVVNMSAAPVVATEVVVENATVVIEERSMGFGDATYSVLILTGEWSDGETTYPVSLVTSEFDPEQESQEVAATLTVGGEGDEDPWFGSGEGNATIEIDDNTVSVSGLFENAWTEFLANATISGTLPADEPEVPTALDNVTTTVAPAKAIVNGQLIIIKNGVQYNAQGQVVK